MCQQKIIMQVYLIGIIIIYCDIYSKIENFVECNQKMVYNKKGINEKIL